MKKNVIILGGGIAGMSAAHELIERGYTVTVLEKRINLPGGKARSIPIKGTATENRKLLPGEHGFRFFPGFYKHITDTMKRIPFAENPNGVLDNLVDSPNIMLTRINQQPIKILSRFPHSLKELRSAITDLLGDETGLTKKERNLIIIKMWQLMTSCKRRRNEEYEQLGWWEFTQAAEQSETYKTLFVTGLTRTLTAAKAESCNTKTNGNVLIQMLFDATKVNKSNDRILNGPTNEKWLDPWYDYLTSKGVSYHFDKEVTDVVFSDQKIIGVKALEGQEEKIYNGDYFICALPVERVAKLLQHNKELLKLDSSLQNIITLSQDVAWMNGIQFFLKEDVSLNKGHIIMADTPWALTAISQAQFWTGINLPKEYGNGDVKGIISIDISDWDKEGIVLKIPAKECTKKQVIYEVWQQLKLSVNSKQNEVIKDDNLYFVFLDEDIIFSKDLFALDYTSPNPKMNQIAKYGSNYVIENEEPLLVNKINTWHLRNESKTKIPNFFLASDYIKTYTDLATMEGANEAARRAVNDLLEAEKDPSPKCDVWELKEPNWLHFFKWLDNRRVERKKEWKFYSPWFVGIYCIIWMILKRLHLTKDV